MAKKIVKAQEDVAKILKVGYRTVNRWIKDGMPVRDDGRYDVDMIRAWRISRMRPKKIKKDPGEWTSEEKYREYKALLAEIDYKKKKGELVLKVDVERENIRKILTCKTALLALPKKVIPQLEGRSFAEMENILTERLKDIIREFSGEEKSDMDKG